MNFGPWIRDIRHRQEIDLITLAQKTGLTGATISRVETERSLATLYTAIRICDGLGVTLADLIQVLRNIPVPPFLKQGQGMPEKVLTIDDVKAFVKFYSKSQQQGHSLLINLTQQLDNLQTNKQGNTTTKVPTADSVDKVLSDLAAIRTLPYPTEIEANKIFETFRLGGALTPTDVGLYVKNVRQEKGTSLVKLEELVGISDSMLSRLETGLIESVKLTEVLKLDEALGKGEILAMYWRAAQLDAQVIHRRPRRGDPLTPPYGWTEKKFTVAFVLITLCRWLQHLNWGETSWLDELRSTNKNVLTDPR